MTKAPLTVIALLLAAFLPITKADDAAKTSKEKEHAVARLEEAATVFNEIMTTSDKGIPKEIMEQAQCVAIVPGLKKGAFIVGAKYGRGFLTCRKAAGGWSAPAAIKVEGGGVGFQIGASETDVVMVVRNERGAQKLMSDKFTLGAEGSVAAGPVGRDASAQTDAQMRAEILSWSRSRGAFAGVSLEGATLRPDEDENADLYGHKMATRQVFETAQMPAAANHLTNLLDQYAGHMATPKK